MFLVFIGMIVRVRISFSWIGSVAKNCVPSAPPPNNTTLQARCSDDFKAARPLISERPARLCYRIRGEASKYPELIRQPRTKPADTVRANSFKWPARSPIAPAHPSA